MRDLSRTSDMETRKQCARSGRLQAALAVVCALCALAGSFSLLATAQSGKARVAQRTFVSQSGEFRFRYPASLILCGKGAQKQSCETYIPICAETALACVAYPKARYAGTNFEGAAFSAKKLPEAAPESKCLDGMKAPVEKEFVNGIEFKSSDDSSAGMGHGVSGRSYRTFHNDACYEFDIRVATSSLGGYEPGTIKEFTSEDEEKLRSALRKILTSLKFSN